VTAERNPLVACVLLLLVAGCSSAAPVESDNDYVEMRPLIYDYGVVFDCVAEAIAEEGLAVKDADRDKGTLETDYVAGKEDRLHGTQKGSRVKACVVRHGPKDFMVRMMATQLERDLGRDNIPGEWRYNGRDQELLDRLRKRFDKQVDKRYKAAPDRGG
jgi:uncharacterized lipoprotein